MKKVKYLWLVLLLVAIMVMSACQPSNITGVLARMQTVVSTEHFEVNGAMMSYFFMFQFSSYYEYYKQMCESYFQNSSGSYTPYDLMGIDPDKSLKEQYMNMTEGEKITVFDYYMGLTEDYVTQMLTYCEFATQHGIALTDQDYQEIDQAIEQLKQDYKSKENMYDWFGKEIQCFSFSEYLSAKYGQGVNESDVRDCLTMITLAGKYEDVLVAELKQSVGSQDLGQAFENWYEKNALDLVYDEKVYLLIEA